MNKTSIGILLAAVLLVASGLYYFFRDVPTPLPQSADTQQQSKGGEIQFIGSSLSEVKDGQKQWEVNADQVVAEANTKMVNLVNIKAQLYGVGNQGNIRMTSKQGQFDTMSKIMVLQGNMHAVSDQGAEFFANMAKWVTTERRLIAEGDVQYRQPDMSISGDKLEAEQNFARFRITGNAKAVLRRGN